MRGLLLLAAAAVPSHAFLAAGGLGPPPARLRAGVQPLAMSETTRVRVTGANKGIGLAICEKLLSDYPEVCVCARGGCGPGEGMVGGLVGKGGACVRACVCACVRAWKKLD